MDWLAIVGLLGTLVTFEEAGRGLIPVIKNKLAKRKINLCNWDSSDPVTQHLLDAFKSKAYAEYKEHIFSQAEIEDIVVLFLEQKKDLRLSYEEKEDISKYIKNILHKYNEYTNSQMSLGEKVIFDKVDVLEDSVKKVDEKISDFINNEDAQKHSKKDKNFILNHVAACINEYLSADEDIFWGENINWYQEIVARLNDKFSMSWKDNVISLLQKVKKSDDAFGDKMDYITSNQSCEMVLQSVKELLESYEWEKEDEIGLYEIVKRGKFSKIFIAIGTEGAGKTYFIRKYLRYTKELIKSNELLFIPVIISVSELEDVSNLFLNKCSEVLCTDICNLEECVEILRDYKLRICFVIDDLQVACIKNTQLLSQLIKQVKDFSRYEEFRWLFTVSEYDYYILIHEQQFIRNYAISGEELMDDRILMHPVFNNVFRLNKYNADNAVNKNIIEELYNVRVRSVEEELCGVEKTSYVVDTPLLAHLFGQSVQNEDAVVELPNTYINFIQKVVDWKNQILLQSPMCVNLQNNIVTILKMCIELKNIEIPSVKISKEICPEVLAELQVNQLVTYIERKDNNIFSTNPITRTYKLQNQMFWAAKIVGFSSEEEKLSVKELKGFPPDFLPWLVSFYILLTKDKDEDEYKILFDDLFSSDLGSYALFCAHKAGSQYSKKLFEYLARNIAMVADIKTCYAVLYFIYFSQLKVEEKFVLFSLLETKVTEFELENAYDLFFRATLNCSTKLKNFKKNILALTEGTVRRINVINGYRCSEKYCDLLIQEKRDFNTSLKELVYDIYKHPALKYQVSISSGGNASFLDYFIRGCFECQLSINPDLIDDYNEFIPLFEGEETVGVFLRRNFTCAAGNYFSKHGKYTRYRNKYIDLVQKLSCKREKKYKETALFLITNSRQNEDKVDNDLLTILKQLLCDPWMEKRYGRDPYVRFWLDNEDIK